jgi:hypothetical protein
MPSMKELVKAALEKKKAANAPAQKGSKVDSKGTPVKDQVSSHKPAKKSAGRGR